jgi:flagellin-like protein
MKEGFKRNKKGLSPVIATVLLIVLVFVLAALIFLWARGLISEQIEKNGQAIENVCPSVNFEANIDSTGDYLEAVNRGSVSIYSFDIKMVKGGESLINKIKIGVDVGKSMKESVDLTMKNGETPEKIIVYPVLIGSIKGGKLNKPYTCKDAGKTISIQ